MSEGQRSVMEMIRDADMVLVGIGEEFDNVRVFQKDAGYREGKELLADSQKSFLIPAWQRLFRELEEHRAEKESLDKGLAALAKALEGKNYFIVSVSTNGQIKEIPWRDGRLVMPCGSDLQVQCGESCACGVETLAGQEMEELQTQLRAWQQAVLRGEGKELPHGLGKCASCGVERGLNNVFHENYNEKGYLEDWQNYTKWLQGTLNRNLLVLELGVGMQFPSVIRWPFEKVAFFNQKAKFYRVNEKLYQLTEELSEKGTSIAENAIDWLQNLC